MDTKITIHHIARACGVSTATVSLALNNRPGVSAETRARVRASAEALGYPLRASIVNSRRLESLGLLVKTDAGQTPQANPFYSQVIAGIEQACRQNGIQLLFSALPVDRDNHPTEIPPLLESELLDGLLLVGAFVDENVRAALGRRALPLVLVDAYSDSERYDAVVSDNFSAAYCAVKHLLGLGHRHIGMAGGSDQAYPSLLQRRNGYLRALKEFSQGEAQLAPYLADFTPGDEQGQVALKALLQAQPQITALFAANDSAALQVLRAAQDLGLSVPKTLSLIGYDDTYLAAAANPPLTTLHVDTLAMGRQAVQLLAQRLEHPEAARVTLTVHATLVERASSAPPPG